MDKIKSSLSIFFLLFVSSTYAQDEELSRHNAVNDFVNELIKKDIDTICDYEIFTDKTSSMYTQYIFWKENGKTKLKKIELNKNYENIEVETDDFWTTLLSNIDIIEKEEVKSFGFIKKIKGKDEVLNVVSDGGDIKEFNTYLKGKMIKFWTSSSDFQHTDIIENKNVININFEYNNNLKGKSIIDKLEMITTKLEKENRLINR
jgi:hypothetical protein